MGTRKVQQDLLNIMVDPSSTLVEVRTFVYCIRELSELWLLVTMTNMRYMMTFWQENIFKKYLLCMAKK